MLNSLHIQYLQHHNILLNDMLNVLSNKLRLQRRYDGMKTLILFIFYLPFVHLLFIFYSPFIYLFTHLFILRLFIILSI